MKLAVTVIVCTHNDSVFLPAAFASCLPHKQPGVEVQVIVVDDASTELLNEKAAQMIDLYGFQYMRHRINRGLAASRNTGLRFAKHDHFLPLDSDDFLYPGALKALLEAIGDADVAYGYMKQGVETHFPNRGSLDRAAFLKENPFFCSSLWKRAMLEKVGGYRETPTPQYEDWCLNVDAFVAGARFKYVPTLVYQHTLRPNAMCAGLNPRHEHFKALATEPLKRSGT